MPRRLGAVRRTRRRRRRSAARPAAQTGFFPTYRSDEDEVDRHSRAELASSPGPAWNEQNATWGQQAIRANLSHLTGRGMKVAVLDTGVATGHPDLAGCLELTASFVPGASVEDGHGHGHGHGTHCIGTVEPLPDVPLHCVADSFSALIAGEPKDADFPHPVLTVLRSSSRDEAIGRPREQLTDMFTKRFAARLEGPRNASRERGGCENAGQENAGRESLSREAGRGGSAETA
ncbi:S8 family serine peptidase [Streptomyces sp. MK37H]|uniref:S8 family serine peptidase n=1 Tax=Streptomyces sp. MK37H TaxID=2699117 RepID=UPI001FFA93D9|nr:S8 family serine peptidase [Streptomyces sp. MK37H]